MFQCPGDVFFYLLESGTWGVPGSHEKEVWTFNDLMPQIEEVFFLILVWWLDDVLVKNGYPLVINLIWLVRIVKGRN